MAAEWTEVEVVSQCSPAAEKGEILLPLDSSPSASKRLLAEGNGESVLLRPGMRADHGTAACLPRATLSVLGGQKARIRYREISFLGVLRRDRWLALQLAIAILTLAGALLGAYGTWIKNSGEAAGTFANSTAVVTFALASALAFAKFFNEYHDL